MASNVCAWEGRRAMSWRATLTWVCYTWRRCSSVYVRLCVNMEGVGTDSSVLCERDQLCGTEPEGTSCGLRRVGHGRAQMDRENWAAGQPGSADKGGGADTSVVSVGGCAVPDFA